MKRLTMLIVVLAILLSNASVFGQPPNCPWRFVTGHWKATDSDGNEVEVVWRPSGENALIGVYNGGQSTELIGWRTDKKQFVSTGYGDGGVYWEAIFTHVTKNRIKGKTRHHLPEGKIQKGTLQVTKKGPNVMKSQFKGTIGGEKVTRKRSWERVKKRRVKRKGK